MDKCENKKSVMWGLSTFKLKSKYTVIFVDFVMCGFPKTCHVDGLIIRLHSLNTTETSRFP